MTKKVAILALFITLYLVVKHLVPYGPLLLYPLILLVTFLHELGHAAFALVTGGDVRGILIHPNGGGHALISGGWTALVAMGGYVGSAVFGNLLLYIGLAKEKWAKWVPFLLAPLFAFTAVWWFQSIFTSIVLFIFAVTFIWLGRKHPKKMSAILLFVGSTSVVYIIEDIGTGPQSDLAVFTTLLPVLPKVIWAAVWLLIVLGITAVTVKQAFSNSQ